MTRIAEHASKEKGVSGRGGEPGGDARRGRSLDHKRTSMSVDDDWHPVRAKMGHMILNPWFDTFFCSLAFLNLILVVIETDANAAGDEPIWIGVLGYIFLLLFAFEAALRVITFRYQVLHCRWTMLDIGILCSDSLVAMASWFGDRVVSVSFLRVMKVMRVLRFVRVIRTLTFFRELYIMLHGFVSALRAIGWATVLLFMMLTVWSVVAVELLHPVVKRIADEGAFENCDRCSRSYSSVAQAGLTFVQGIIADDSWGLVAVPVMEAEPWTTIVFMLVLISLDLGLLNLILTVIVDRAAQARQEDKKFVLRQRHAQFESAKAGLLEQCKELDEDKAGALSLDQLLSAFDTEKPFEDAMRLMDISREDIRSLFHILDEENSGSVDYCDFVEQLHKMKSQDSQMMLVFIRSYIKDVKLKVYELRDSLTEQYQRYAQVSKELQTLAEPLKAMPDLQLALCRGLVVSSGAKIDSKNDTEPSGAPAMSARSSQQEGSFKDYHPDARTRESTPPDSRDWSTSEELASELQQMRQRMSKDLEAVMTSVDESLVTIFGSVQGSDAVASVPRSLPSQTTTWSAGGGACAWQGKVNSLQVAARGSKPPAAAGLKVPQTQIAKAESLVSKSASPGRVPKAAAKVAASPKAKAGALTPSGAGKIGSAAPAACEGSRPLSPGKTVRGQSAAKAISKAVASP